MVSLSADVMALRRRHFRSMSHYQILFTPPRYELFDFIGFSRSSFAATAFVLFIIISAGHGHDFIIPQQCVSLLCFGHYFLSQISAYSVSLSEIADDI